MAGEPTRPLTPEQAKARLRAAAERASPAGWIHGHPWQAAGMAMLAGFTIARLDSLALAPALGARLLGVAAASLPALLRQRP